MTRIALLSLAMTCALSGVALGQTSPEGGAPAAPAVSKADEIKALRRQIDGVKRQIEQELTDYYNSRSTRTPNMNQLGQGGQSTNINGPLSENFGNKVPADDERYKAVSLRHEELRQELRQLQSQLAAARGR